MYFISVYKIVSKSKIETIIKNIFQLYLLYIDLLYVYMCINILSNYTYINLLYVYKIYE